jgi:hypothetical protein
MKPKVPYHIHKSVPLGFIVGQLSIAHTLAAISGKIRLSYLPPICA